MDGDQVGASILIESLSKVFSEGNRSVNALSGFDLEVKDGEFICLLGPSGCGKTTVLRIVAGLERKSTGNVIVQGHEVTSAGFNRGMVFQEFALFPWRTVRKNIEFGLEMKDVPPEKRMKISS